MNNESSPKALASISLCVSSLSAIISGAAIALNAPRYSQLGFDYTAVIIAAFALIVTALIGLQVAQYIFSGDRMQRIAKDTAKPIAEEISNSVSKGIADKAAKEANAIAEETAQKTAKDTVTLITGDLKHILDALSPLVNARIDTVIGDSARAIGYYLTSLDSYNHIQDSSLHQEYTSNLLEELLHRVQTWKKEETLYIEKQYVDSAVTLLDTFDSPSSREIKEALLNADERNPNEKMYITSMKSL